MEPVLHMIQRLELEVNPHSPISNPSLTYEAEAKQGDLEKVVKKNTLPPREKMVETEAALLQRWSFFNHSWEKYLDSPLIAHADAILGLKSQYDAVVEIESAGFPYVTIFGLLGFNTYGINYSQHKRRMEIPEIDNFSLVNLKRHHNVLLVDIDFVTGKTLREVTSFLRRAGVNVTGAYIGLSEWKLPKCRELSIDKSVIDFDNLWKLCGRTRQLRTKQLYESGIIPPNFRLFNADPSLDKNEERGSLAANRVANYLLSHRR